MVRKQVFVSILFALVLSFMLSGPAMAQAQAQAQSRPQSQTRISKRSLKTQIQSPSPKKDKGLEGSWNLRLKNSRFEDAFNQKNMTEFRVGMELKYTPLENIYFRLAPHFNYTNGFAQSQEETKSDSSAWSVKEAALYAEPMSDLWLSAGALDQGADHPALLLEDIAFPALRMSLQTDSKSRFSAGLQGETAIPTSSSLSTQTSEFEKTPSYNSGSLFIRLQKTLIEGSAQIGMYQYQNIPSSVATKAGLNGNSTTPTSSGNESVFIYQYQGAFAKADFKTHLGKYIRLLTLGEWAKNDRAPREYNQALRSRTGAEFDLSSSFQVTPYYEYFRIEPDAVISSYNGSWLNTNRVGYNAGLEMAYKKTLKISIFAGERDVVFETPFQQRERTWYVTLETFDVAI